MKNHLNENHYRNPGICKQAMSTRQLKETLLVTNGQVLACGRSWNIKSQKIGPGVYRVCLEAQ